MLQQIGHYNDFALLESSSFCQLCDTLPFYKRVGDKLFFFCFFFLFSKEKKKGNFLNPPVSYADIPLFKGD